MHLGLVLAGVSPDKAEHYYVDRYVNSMEIFFKWMMDILDWSHISRVLWLLRAELHFIWYSSGFIIIIQKHIYGKRIHIHINLKWVDSALHNILHFLSDQDSMEGIALQTEKTFGNVLMNRFLRYTQRWKNEKYSFPKFR